MPHKSSSAPPMQAVFLKGVLNENVHIFLHFDVMLEKKSLFFFGLNRKILKIHMSEGIKPVVSCNKISKEMLFLIFE